MLREQTVAIVDLGDISRRLVHGSVDVVLGRELFDAGPLLVDIQAGRIGPVMGARRGVRLSLSEANGIERLPISIEGGPSVQAEFDLGNGGDMLVGLTYAKRAGLLTDGRPLGKVSGGGLGGAQSRIRLTLRSVTVAGRVFRDVVAVVDPNANASDANIGVAQLRAFQIVADYPGRSIVMEAI